jgi:hypothetical protein
VLGIEDGRTAIGHRQSIGDNSLKARGVQTSFELLPDRTVTFRHIIGAVPLFALPESMSVAPGCLKLRSEGAEFGVPFDSDFLAPERYE